MLKINVQESNKSEANLYNINEPQSVLNLPSLNTILNSPSKTERSTNRSKTFNITDKSSNLSGIGVQKKSLFNDEENQVQDHKTKEEVAANNIQNNNPFNKIKKLFTNLIDNKGNSKGLFKQKDNF